MEQRSRTLLACAGVVAIFLVIQLGALALVEPFQQEGHQMVEDTDDPSLSIFFLLAILGVTALMLAAIKYGGTFVIKGFVIFAGIYITYFVFNVIVPTLVTVSVAGGTLDVIALAGALALGAALYLYPEWYVIDSAGIVMGIGAAGLFGINFGILPALVLLVVLAIYDAISVYRTKHMLTLASGITELRVPVLLVVPTTLSYSFLDADVTGEESPSDDVVDTESTAEGRSDNEPLTAAELEALSSDEIANLDRTTLAEIDDETLETVDDETREALEAAFRSREALFIGLGDAVIPTILIVSVAFFVDADSLTVLGLSANLPAVTAMLGTLVGLVVLLSMVLKGRAHAGLPLLNGGAILGYLVGAFLAGMTLVEALGVGGLI